MFSAFVLFSLKNVNNNAAALLLSNIFLFIWRIRHEIQLRNERQAWNEQTESEFKFETQTK